MSNANKRKTAEYITSLNPNEVFVFGSNREGYHGGGAAAMALMFFGAKWGQGVGMQGKSYAIPTMDGSLEMIAWYVEVFVVIAREHPELHFLVTEIGCGIAGFTPQQIAPLFHSAIALDNVSLPKRFWAVLNTNVDEQ